MDALGKLAAFLPRLRTPLQLTGLIVIVAAVVMTQSAEAANIHANISLGAIGVLLLVFGQLFHFLGASIPAGQRGTVLVIMFVIFCLFVISLIGATSYFYIKKASPNIVLLDSTAPARVYSPMYKTQGRLNGAILTEILKDLPVTIVHDPTHPNWVVNRCEQIRKLDPALVIVHQSAFCSPEVTTADCHESEAELVDFFRCMADTRTKFMVYTRYAFGGAVIARAEEAVPQVKGRLIAFPMTRKTADERYLTHDFADPSIQRDLKQRVRGLLSAGR